MTLRFPSNLLQTFLALIFLVISHSSIAQANEATNLQVLPVDIPDRALRALMIENLSGLGLPRLQGEGCLFCHEGDMDLPRSEWDFAADSKLNKRKAREMMAMVQDINTRLAGLEQRVAPNLRVTCATCHAGRTDPRPLQQVLLGTHADDGIGATIEHYRNLRQRYYGGDAYDFRINSLISVATSLAIGGALEDAIAISQLNEEIFEPSTTAQSFTLTLQIEQAIQSDGLNAGLAYFDARYDSAEPNTISWNVLDGLGWQYFRTNRQDAALQIFRKNQAQFPNDYIPNESLGDALWNSGNREQGLAMFEAWLASHPDHTTASRRLAGLLSENQ